MLRAKSVLILGLLGRLAYAQAPPELEQVTVTATKQAAVDVNKVPISISAYGQQEMDVRGLRDVSDIAAITPGLTFSQQNDFGTPQTNISIRGIQSRTSAPTTGIYLDDTPLVGRANNVNTGMNGGYPVVFDFDRIEVLRGPQGTLFGASSEGGAVRFITKQPNLTQSSLYARTEVSQTRDGDPSWEAPRSATGSICRYGRPRQTVCTWDFRWLIPMLITPVRRERSWRRGT